MEDISIVLYGFMLSGAVFHAANNILTKKLFSRGVGEDFVAVATMAIAGFMGLFGSFALHGIPKLRPGFAVPFLAAAALTVFWYKFHLRSMDLEDASVVVPLSSASPISAAVISFFFLGQQPTLWGGIGIGVVAAGVYAANLREPVELPKRLAAPLSIAWRARVERVAGPLLRLTSSRGAWYAVIAWGVFGGSALVITRAVVFSSDPFFRTGATFLFVAFVLWVDSLWRGTWRDVPKRRSSIALVLAAGITLGMSDALYSFGYYYGIVPYLGALKQAQVPLTVFLASFFLAGEKHVWQRFIGSIMVFAGIVLLSF